MRFTITDVREVFDKDTSLKFMATLHGIANGQDRSIKVGNKVEYVPFVHRTGTAGTQRQIISVFDMNRLFEIYEDRLTSYNHRHIIASTKRYLDRLTELKEHMNELG